MILLKIIKAKFLGNAPRLNLFKTIVFNYKLLPFKQAVKLPIFMYGKWNLHSLKGRIIIHADNVTTEMFRFGADTTGYFTAAISTFSMLDNSMLQISFGVRIGQGVQICLLPGSKLVLKEKASLNDNVKVICSSNIEIGERTDVTWECQVTDYNSHYVMEKSATQVSSISKPVIIGDYCWIGNRTSIMPGTVLPNRVIVTSNSLLNKNYIDKGIKEYSMIGGCPAKPIKEGVYRLYKKENYDKIKKYFKNNPESSFYELSSDDNFEE